LTGQLVRLILNIKAPAHIGWGFLFGKCQYRMSLELYKVLQKQKTGCNEIGVAVVIRQTNNMLAVLLLILIIWQWRANRKETAAWEKRIKEENAI
jgi:hypothetical protein